MAKPMVLDFEEIDYQNKGIPEPSLKLTNNFAQPFLKALAEALDKQGVKTENDFKIQGLLEATKYHLEDMRKLTFKKEKYNE